jgi:hypothetical protein
VQDKKGIAEQQLESLTGLENMKYVFNKTEISRSTEESCAFAWGKSARWPFSFFCNEMTCGLIWLTMSED